MLTGLFKGRQSIEVGGPIGSMKDAKSKSLANPDYKAAYLLKRLTGYEPDSNPGLDMTIDRYRPEDSRPWMDQAEKTAFLMNAVKGYEAEAEESLKLEFKDWLRGEHNDNNDPQPYNNAHGGLKRRDTRGEQLDEWYPTWWGKKQLTHLPGVREYLREDHISADKHSFDMNMLAHFGPSNLEEAWAYFKYWVKRRPVGPWIRLNEPDASANANTPFERSGPISMAPADAVLNIETNARGIKKVQMPELARREAGNTSLLDRALTQAVKESAALRNTEEADRLRKEADALDAADKQKEAEILEALKRADPFKTKYAKEMFDDGYFEPHMKSLQQEYKNTVAQKAKSEPEVLWRKLMANNDRQFTREEYNRVQNYTGMTTEAPLQARMDQLMAIKGVSPKMKELIGDLLKDRFNFKGSYADHYHHDKLLLKQTDAWLKQAQVGMQLTRLLTDRKEARAASAAAQAAEQAAEQEARDKIDALVQQRVDAILRKRGLLEDGDDVAEVDEKRVDEAEVEERVAEVLESVLQRVAEVEEEDEEEGEEVEIFGERGVLQSTPGKAAADSSPTDTSTTLEVSPASPAVTRMNEPAPSKPTMKFNVAARAVSSPNEPRRPKPATGR